MKICPKCRRQFADDTVKFCGNDGGLLETFQSPPPVAQAVHNQTAQQVVNQSPQPIRSAHAASFSPSLLIYFFADQFIEQAGFLGGTEAPCREVKVNTNDLTDEMMAAAFWFLREGNFISMRLGEKTGLIFKSSPVEVQVLQNAQIESGLERDFYEILRAWQTASTIKNVVVAHLRVDTQNPRSEILTRIKQWAVHTGCGQFVKKKGMIFSKTVFEADCGRISNYGAEAQNLNNKWQNFKTQEPELYEAMIKECGSAVSARTERDRDNDYDSSYD